MDEHNVFIFYINSHYRTINHCYHDRAPRVAKQN